MLRFMGSQRVGHDRATKLNIYYIINTIIIITSSILIIRPGWPWEKCFTGSYPFVLLKFSVSLYANQ